MIREWLKAETSIDVELRSAARDKIRFQASWYANLAADARPGATVADRFLKGND